MCNYIAIESNLSGGTISKILENLVKFCWSAIEYLHDIVGLFILVLGVLFITNFKLFTLSKGDVFEKAKKQYKIYGIGIITIIIIYFILRIASFNIKQ